MAASVVAAEQAARVRWAELQKLTMPCLLIGLTRLRAAT